jgi:hypothetical protein
MFGEDEDAGEFNQFSAAPARNPPPVLGQANVQRNLAPPVSGGLFGAADFKDTTPEHQNERGTKLNSIFDYDVSDEEESKGGVDLFDQKFEEEQNRRKTNALFKVDDDDDDDGYAFGGKP